MNHTYKLRLITLLICMILCFYLGFNPLKEYFVDSEQDSTFDNLVINEIMIQNTLSHQNHDGDYAGWVELYNSGDTEIKLEGFGLSNDVNKPKKWIFPNVIIKPKSYVVVWLTEENKSNPDEELHANFKLTESDYVLRLTSKDNKWFQLISIPSMASDVSIGRYPDGSEDIYAFETGTPNDPNTQCPLKNGALSERISAPYFSHESGFYTSAFQLVLDSQDEETKTYYTVDGSEPTEDSLLYKEPIHLQFESEETYIIRARSYKSGERTSEITTKTYFNSSAISTNHPLPIISLVTDPEYLYDYEDGIFVDGAVYDHWVDSLDELPANFKYGNYSMKGRRWERYSHIELFDSTGQSLWNQNIGIRVQGGYSRKLISKSIGLYARDFDGEGVLTYNFYETPELSYSTQKHLTQLNKMVLRTGATDFYQSFIRNYLGQSLAVDINGLDIQQMRICLLYINGKYEGIRYLLNGFNDIYFERAYDIKSEELSILVNPTGIIGTEIEAGIVGDEMHYSHLYQFIKESDMSDSSAYEYVKTLMDTTNFIEYNILQIYSGNGDWPGNNVRVWRKRTDTYIEDAPYGHDGRWRWLVFDLDDTFGLKYGNNESNDTAVSYNHLLDATALDGPEWPNPEWSTMMLRKLLENESFRTEFINTFATRLNSEYSEDRSVSILNNIESYLFPYVPKQLETFNISKGDVTKWQSEVKDIRTYLLNRPAAMQSHIIDYFDLEGVSTVSISASKGGKIKIHTLEIQSEQNWTGKYFNGVPILIEAIPDEGYIFQGWGEELTETDSSIFIELDGDLDLFGTFKKIN